MEDTITIPRAEYDRLREAAEDLEDIRAYDRAKAEGGPAVPAEFVDRMLAGENLVTLWRQHRGLTIAQLAEKSGVHRTVISRLEHGHRGVRAETMRALADALGVKVDDLIG